MQKLHMFIIAVTFMATLMNPLQSQDFAFEPSACTECTECVDDSCAYYGGARAAHWSAYVPIGVLIVAAVWLGFVDSTSTQSCSSSKCCSNYCH